MKKVLFILLMSPLCRELFDVWKSVFSILMVLPCHSKPEFLDSGRHWTLNTGLWTLDSGPWTLDSGLWTLDSGRWTLDAWLGLMDTFVNWGTQFLILLDVTGILWRVCSNMTCYIVKEYRLKKLQCEKLD